MSGNFLKTLLKDRSEELYFFSALKRERLKVSEQRSLDYKWTGRLSPSSLYYSMCPYTFIREEVHKPRTRSRDELSSLRSMEFGKALHHHYSQEAKRVKDLLYPFPNFPNELKAKARRMLPEIYFHDKELEISGKIDLVLKLEDEPVIVDLKITGRPITDFPLDSSICQIMIYVYCINRLGYYDKEVKRAGLLYQNPFEGKGWESEFYWNYSEYKDKTETLIDNLTRERLRFLAGSPSTCEYPYCKEHRVKV